MAMKHLNLEKFFERVILAHDLMLDKKGPELWLRAAELCGAEPGECTVFDDSLAACRGARQAGMRTVGVYDQFFDRHQKELEDFCDVYIRSFEELLLPEARP